MTVTIGPHTWEQNEVVHYMGRPIGRFEDNVRYGRMKPDGTYNHRYTFEDDESFGFIWFNRPREEVVRYIEEVTPLLANCHYMIFGAHNPLFQAIQANGIPHRVFSYPDSFDENIISIMFLMDMSSAILAERLQKWVPAPLDYVGPHLRTVGKRLRFLDSGCSV